MPDNKLQQYFSMIQTRDEIKKNTRVQSLFVYLDIERSNPVS